MEQDRPQKFEMVDRPGNEFTENKGYTAHPLESPPPPPEGFATPMQPPVSETGSGTDAASDSGK